MPKLTPSKLSEMIAHARGEGEVHGAMNMAAEVISTVLEVFNEDGRKAIMYNVTEYLKKKDKEKEEQESGEGASKIITLSDFH